MPDLAAHGAKVLLELHDRKMALKSLKAQVHQLNVEYHSAKSKCQRAEARLWEVQEQEQAAQQGAERATNQVTARDECHKGVNHVVHCTSGLLTAAICALPTLAACFTHNAPADEL